MTEVEQQLTLERQKREKSEVDAKIMKRYFCTKKGSCRHNWRIGRVRGIRKSDNNGRIKKWII